MFASFGIAISSAIGVSSDGFKTPHLMVLILYLDVHVCDPFAVRLVLAVITDIKVRNVLAHEHGDSCFEFFHDKNVCFDPLSLLSLRKLFFL